MRNRLSSLSNDENQLTSYLKVIWPAMCGSQSSTPTPPLLHLPVAGRRSFSPSSASPAASRDPSPSVGTVRDRSPSVPSSPYLVVSAAADRPATSVVDEPDDRSTENHLQPPAAWDSASAADTSKSAAEKQRPASLYSRRRTVLKAIREKSLSIDVEKLDMQRPPTTNDVIIPRS